MRMRRAAGLSVVIVAMSCGGETADGTAGSGEGGGTYTCQTACEHIGSAQCVYGPCFADDKYAWECPRWNFFDVSDCRRKCEPSLTVTTGCGTEALDYLRCFSTARLTCEATGYPYPNERGRLDETSCESQTLAWESCSACNVIGSDNDCTSCLKSTCCAELQAALGDPDRFGYKRCVGACTDDTDAACLQGCDDQYTSLLQKRSNLTNCGNAACTACCLERGVTCYEGGPICCSGTCPRNGVCA
jgi:hypothetical protein